MTTEEKARAYDEALERAKEIKSKILSSHLSTESCKVISEYIDTIIPELRESEDERMMREFNDWLCEEIECLTNDLRDEEDRRTLNMLCYVLTKVKDWLEKQKEQKPAESISQLTVQGKGVYKICPRCKERMVRDDSMIYTSMPPQYRYECPKCGESECDTVMYDNPEMEEQKPNSTEDMPYITDEHFYEREPADSFKYKLAEYMTRCCTKKEGPYGYEYGISAESILKMAEEELLKRGVVQKPAENGVDVIKTSALLAADRLASAEMTGRLKERSEILDNPTKYGLQKPAEWSVEDEMYLSQAIEILEHENYFSLADKLKSLHFPPKQEWSEEDEERLKAICTYLQDYPRLAKINDVKRFNEYCDWLKSLPLNLKKKNEDVAKLCSNEWNKEDEIMLKWIEDILLIADDDLNDKLNGKVSPITDSAYSSMKLCIAKCLSWLKSLPLNLKKKNEDVAKLCSKEWSQEDEDRIRQIERIAQQAGCTQKLQEEIHDWLKSLRPSWKPSEHQMNILKAVKDYVGKGSGYWGEGLGSLIDDLEKLM